MSDKDFEKLKKAIERKMNELSSLQLIHIKETGVSYIPCGIDTKNTEERMRREIDKMKWNIGDEAKDADGNIGVIGIRWNDGDFCTIENDVAHPNPKLISELGRKASRKALRADG